MTKTYCDYCKQEVSPDRNTDREGKVNIASGKYIFSVNTVTKLVDAERHKYDKAVEDIYICLYCRIDALKALDNRPKAIAT